MINKQNESPIVNQKDNQMNVGKLDQILRITIGGLLIFLAAFNVLGNWAYIGFIPFLTGVIRWCPLYTLFGVQTCPQNETVQKNQ